MTMIELSLEYRAHAGVLKDRLSILRAQEKNAFTKQERLYLQQRIYLLQTMWRETRDIAVLTERYYEKGYRRNDRYTL